MADMFPGTSTGVFSLLTLSTPHEGSVAAQVARLIADGVESGAPSALNALLSVYLYGYTSVADLTPADVRRFNAFTRHNNSVRVFAQGPSLVAANKVKYRAIGADADLNASGSIEANEGGVMPSNFLDNAMYHLLGNVTEIHMIPGISGGWIVGPNPPSTIFHLNDIAVTTASAYYSSQPGLFQSEPLREANHGTVRLSAVAYDVLWIISLAEEKSLEQSIVQ